MGEISNGKSDAKKGISSLLFREKDPTKEARRAVKPLEAEFPYVAELLGGIPANGDQPAVLPCTITFFHNEGKIRFSVNVKSLSKTFIGDIEDVVNPWGSLNTALAMGEVADRPMREYPSTNKNNEEPPY